MIKTYKNTFDIDEIDKLEYLNVINEQLFKNKEIRDMISSKKVNIIIRKQSTNIEFDGGSKFANGEFKSFYNCINVFTENGTGKCKMSNELKASLFNHEAGHVFSEYKKFIDTPKQMILYDEMMNNKALRKYSPYARVNSEEMTAEYFELYFNKEKFKSQSKEVQEFCKKIINELL